MIRLMLLLALSISAGAAAGLPSPTRRLDGRIIGGESVNIEDYPYQLSLEYHGIHICGASILSPYYALTAGHCVDGFPISALTVRTISTYGDATGQVVTLSRVILHPNYNRFTIDYDISLLHLADPLQKGSAVDLVEQGQEVPVGTPVIVSGWGTLAKESFHFIQLQAVFLEIVSDKKCKEVYGEKTITDRMICAGSTDDIKAVCQGDSGAPMVIAGTKVQVGIFSWGFGCDRPGIPGIYTKISSLRNWIKENSGI